MEDADEKKCLKDYSECLAHHISEAVYNDLSNDKLFERLLLNTSDRVVQQCCGHDGGGLGGDASK